MVRVIFLCLFIALLAACQNGAPLPEPTGPWEPLNGWTPPNADDMAQR